MMEPIYNTLFGHKSNDKDLELALKVIENDQILARNFSTYLINKNISIRDTLKIKSLFDSSITMPEKLDSLNKLISLNDIIFKVNPDKKLYLTLYRTGQNVELLCPDFNYIVSDKMVYPESIFSLLETREKINSKLIDLTFTKNIDSKSDFLQQCKYYYENSKSN